MNKNKSLAKTIMIQGTGSFVGKSVIVTALCRILKQEGYKVAPFKSQNMSLNSYIASGNKEISRAQAVQAEAAGIEPTVEMNPILLKPSGSKTQVVLMGKPVGNLTLQEYQIKKKEFWLTAKCSLQRLREEYEIVVIEGAGSPAEINISEDICNMQVAKVADSPVLLVGDIDRGGVFASLIGTLDLLFPAEREFVKGFIINKFRGDYSLLKPGLDFLEKRTNLPVIGVIPFVSLLSLPEEDSQFLDQNLSAKDASLKIGVIRLPHIANFTDFEILRLEPFISLIYLKKPREADKLDMLIIPGSKNAIEDLIFLKEQGWEGKIKELITKKILIMGICGGFQMMGKSIRDPFQLESEREEVEGLGLFDITTTLCLPKQTYKVEANPSPELSYFGINPSSVLRGYEIHLGRTIYGSKCAPAFLIFRRGRRKVSIIDGAFDSKKGIIGTYIHDLLENDGFRKSLIAQLLKKRGLNVPMYYKRSNTREQTYNRLAELVRRNVNVQYILELLQLERSHRVYFV